MRAGANFDKRTTTLDAHYASERVSTFIPAKDCGRCGGVTHVITPRAWPVGTVARACYSCGRIVEYVDNLYIFTKREAFAAARQREWAVRGGSARQPSNAEAARALIIMGTELGLDAATISLELDVHEDYVKHVAAGR